jgi:hypothetical protein
MIGRRLSAWQEACASSGTFFEDISYTTIHLGPLLYKFILSFDAVIEHVYLLEKMSGVYLQTHGDDRL